MTKNEFFAQYFIGELDQIKYDLEEFSRKGEEQFTLGEEAYPSNNIKGRLEALLEEWEKCVIENEQELYPVIDCWNESEYNPANNV